MYNERMILNLRLFIFMMILSAVTPACAVVSDTHPTGPGPRGPSHAPSELIVKFRSQAGKALEQSLQQKSFPALGIDSLDELFKSYRVTAAKSVLSGGPSAEEVKKKFPVRARRAPKDAKTPDMKYIYVLTTGPGVDTMAAVHAFASDPNVEYAQPNYIATVF